MNDANSSDFFDPTTPAPRVATPQSTRLARLMREAAWLVLLAVAVYLVLILATRHAQDAGFFFSGKSSAILNRGGALGAWFADFFYGVFGLAAWWWVALTGYAVLRLFRRVESWSVFDRRNLAARSVQKEVEALRPVESVNRGHERFFIGIVDVPANAADPTQLGLL